jgi:hypothetical protein
LTPHVSKIHSRCVVLGMATEIGMRRTASRQLTLQEELAFEQIVFGQRHRLYVIALGILRDRGEAEDAVQETLVRTGEPGSPPLATAIGLPGQREFASITASVGGVRWCAAVSSRNATCLRRCTLPPRRRSIRRCWT